MTAVLSPSDPFRRDMMGSHDDNPINYSPTSSPVDWRQKYNEVADMLTETRAELDDFHQSSKELEEELERELERTEKAQEDLKVKASRAESERDEWKTKFVSLQTTHNTTTTSLQRELDKLRQEHQVTKVQLRELEMGNDDLERNERAVSSSLADIEAKYSRALEEKILLEHELLDKANVEEHCQRLKDELRDANSEISIIKDKLAALQASASTTSITLSSNMPPASSKETSSDENLLSTAPPDDLQLSELSHDFSPPISTDSPRTQASLHRRAGHHQLRPMPSTPSQPPSAMSRSATLPIFNTTPTRLQPRPSPALPRPLISRSPSTVGTNGVSAYVMERTVSKNKGVQMVSEMRARVKNLEQKIHTRVPRLRMGSVNSRSTAAMASMPPPAPSSRKSMDFASVMPPPATIPTPRKSIDNTLMSSTSSSRSASRHEERPAPMTSRLSMDSLNGDRKTPQSDSSGWVLVMDDTPSPLVNKERRARERGADRRRPTSPGQAPTSFRASVSTAKSPISLSSSTSTSYSFKKSLSGSPTKSTLNLGMNSSTSMSSSTATRRPSSGMSNSNYSPSTSRSAIPMSPTSQPLTSSAVLSGGLYGYSSPTNTPVNSVGVGLRRPTGPSASSASAASKHLKRSSLDLRTLSGAFSYRDLTMPSPSPPRADSVTPNSASSTSSHSRPNSTYSNYSNFSNYSASTTAESPKAPTQLPSLSNVTLRSSSRIAPPETPPSLLTKSRIGRPSGSLNTRRNDGAETLSPTTDDDFLSSFTANRTRKAESMNDKSRTRSGSTARAYGRY